MNGCAELQSRAHLMDHLLRGNNISNNISVVDCGRMNGSIGQSGGVNFAASAYSHAHNHAFQSNGKMLGALHSLGHNHGPSAPCGGQGTLSPSEEEQGEQPPPAQHHHHHIQHEHFPNPSHFVQTGTVKSSFSASSAMTAATGASEAAPYYVRQAPLPPPVPSLPPQYHPYHNHLPLERLDSHKQAFQGANVNGHSHQLPPASAEPTLKNPKKSSLKKRSKFDVITRSTQSLTNLVATSGATSCSTSQIGAAQQTGKSSMGLMPSLTRKQSSGSAKHVEIVHFAIKGGPPWGFRIKQRNDNVFISKVSVFVFYMLKTYFKL